MHLTDEEITNALAFDFPAIREAHMDMLYASVLMRCECGEDTPQAMTWPTEKRIECPCGRVWLAEVTYRLPLREQAMQTN